MYMTRVTSDWLSGWSDPGDPPQTSAGVAFPSSSSWQDAWASPLPHLVHPHRWTWMCRLCCSTDPSRYPWAACLLYQWYLLSVTQGAKVFPLGTLLSTSNDITQLEMLQNRIRIPQVSFLLQCCVYECGPHRHVGVSMGMTMQTCWCVYVYGHADMLVCLYVYGPCRYVCLCVWIMKICWSVYVCGPCRYVGVGICTCVWCLEVNVQSFSPLHPILFLRQEPSLNLGFINWLEWLASELQN